MGNICSNRNSRIRKAKDRLQVDIDRFSWQIGIDLDSIAALDRSARDYAKRGDKDQALFLIKRKHKKIKMRKELMGTRENLIDMRNRIDTGE